MYNNTKEYEDFNTEDEIITKSIIIIINNLNIKIQNIQKKEKEKEEFEDIIKNICEICINSLDICSFEITNNNIDFNDIINKETINIIELSKKYSNIDIINLLNILYKLYVYL